MAGQDDIALVRDSLNGDLKAFETLVERYQKVVFNLALRMSHSYVDAQDITQNVFLKAFEKLGTFDIHLRFFSWLYRIAINESLNVLRLRKPTTQLTDDLGSESEENDAEETETKIQQALMDLKIDQRAVVILKHFQNLSYQEISQVLDISEKKVKSRLFTARIALRDILKKRGLTVHG